MSGRGNFSQRFLLMAAALTVLVVLPYLLKATTVYGNSMLPTLEDGDRLLIDKWSYRLAGPERFDVVVFSYPYKPHTYYIKRVIALPGEKIRISADGVIYVNDKALIEHYGNAPMLDSGLAANEMTLAQDEYFVLGDNRNFSADSRDPGVGNIKRSNIMGRGWFCLTPSPRFGVLK